MSDMIYNYDFKNAKAFTETHFTMKELTHTSFGVNNEPNGHQKNRLERLRWFLESIRRQWGKPIIINQAFRSRAVNDAMLNAGMHPSATSAHLRGDAADLRCGNWEEAISMAAAILTASQKDAWDFDQLLIEYNRKGSVWIHFGLNDPANKPRRQVRLMKG